MASFRPLYFNRLTPTSEEELYLEPLAHSPRGGHHGGHRIAAAELVLNLLSFCLRDHYRSDKDMEANRGAKVFLRSAAITH